MKRPSFLALPRPVATCILREDTVDQAIATIKNGEFKGAPAFAVHMENLKKEDMTDENFRRIANCTRRPVMFLRYRGGLVNYTDEERVDILTRAAQCGAAAVDFTADTFEASPREFTDKPEIVERQMRAIDRIHEIGAEVVMSSHMAEALTCEQVLEHMKSVEKRGVDYAKIVTQANTEEEFLEAVRTTMALRREMKVPFIHLCGGSFGLPMRYLCPSLGNAMTFCVDHYTSTFVTGQPPIENMLAILNNYHWHIDEVSEK